MNISISHLVNEVETETREELQSELDKELKIAEGELETSVIAEVKQAVLEQQKGDLEMIELPKVDLTGVPIVTRPEMQPDDDLWLIVGFTDYAFLPVTKIWYTQILNFENTNCTWLVFC